MTVLSLLITILTNLHESLHESYISGFLATTFERVEAFHCGLFHCTPHQATLPGIYNMRVVFVHTEVCTVLATSLQLSLLAPLKLGARCDCTPCASLAAPLERSNWDLRLPRVPWVPDRQTSCWVPPAVVRVVLWRPQDQTCPVFCLQATWRHLTS